MRKAREGFILIAALWLLIALGAISLEASLRSRTRRLAAANMLDAQHAQDVAFSAIEYARSRLTAAMLGRADELRTRVVAQNPRANSRNTSVQSLFRNADPAEDPWRDPQSLVPSVLSIENTSVELDIRDTGAAVHVNFADEATWRQFLSQGLGLDYAAAQRLTMAILDWRDEDDIPRINGGEREQYLVAGAPVLPANRPFGDLEELRHVLGMTPEIYNAMRPFLTLSGPGLININVAPEEVLLAIPGMTPAAAQQLLRLRRVGTLPRNFNELQSLLPAPSIAAIQAQRQLFNRRVDYATTVVEVTAKVDIPNSPVGATAQAVISRRNAGSVVLWRKVDS